MSPGVERALMQLAEEAPHLTKAMNNLSRSIDRFVRAQGPNDIVNSRRPVCDMCQGKGWDLYMESSGLIRLKKCSDCNMFESDKDAAIAANPFLVALAGRIKKGEA